jgi:hypothetical protein
MSNIYASSFKDVLKGYREKALKLQSEMANLNSNFAGDLLKEKSLDLKARIEQEHDKAIKDIVDIFESVKGYLSIASFPDTAQLTTDNVFFNGNAGIDLKPAEIKAFIERYNDNYTMLRLIREWVQTNYANVEEYETAIRNIYLPADQLEVYRQFGQSALEIVEMIYNNRGVMLEPLEIEAYADEEVKKDKFAIIGNGMGLSAYRTRRVPETAKHLFDSVELKTAYIRPYVQGVQA